MREPRLLEANQPRTVTWGGGSLQRMQRNRPAVAACVLLAAFYVAGALAPFLAPYPEDAIDRSRFFHPPQTMRLVDAHGHVRGLHVLGTRLVDPVTLAYVADPDHAVPVRWFVHGARYRLFGVIPCDRHLFGVEAPERINLLGTDGLGRDVGSRLLFGAQVSLNVGLIGIVISFTLGMLAGGVSGYFGGWIDSVIMRFTELLLTIPGFYLIIALRTLLPTELPSRQTYLAIVAILALLGWASLARVIRGMVLSLREQEFVTAARALGMSPVRIIVRHLLPNTASFAIVAATVAVPGYILGEVFLSFIGVGVQEPAASWGNMLNQARSLRVLASFPWLLCAPGTAIFLTVMAFNILGDGLRDALDPRRA